MNKTPFRHNLREEFYLKTVQFGLLPDTIYPFNLKEICIT